MTDRNCLKAFNIKFHPWDLNTTLDFIEDNIISHKINMQHIVVNVAKLVNAQKNIDLRNAINESHLVNIDGLPVVVVLRMLGYDVPERVAGIDLFLNLLSISELKGYKIYFLGATQEVIENMVSKVREKYPRLSITGFRNGYFLEDEELDIAENIQKSKSDILFLGISSPKKEFFINKYSRLMNVPFTMGVGGSFDIISGKTKRAPQWMQRSGFEWFYRLCQEPNRMWKRYLITNTQFFYLATRELLKHHAKKLR